MSDLDLGVPFPVEFLINDTARSHQSKNVKAKELWKQRVRAAAAAHVRSLRDFVFIDRRPLAATILYFPLAPMDGDVDNIVKLILDGMVTAVYPDDSVLERVVVQKFEPGIACDFSASTDALRRAAEEPRPVVYIRIDDDLRWRQPT